jgi:hypothetical protein
MHGSQIWEYISAALFILIVAAGFAYLGGCAEEGEDSKQEQETTRAKPVDVSKAEDIKVELQKRMEMLRNQHKAIGVQELVKTYGYQVVPAAEPYLSDSEVRVRLRATSLIRRAALMSSDKQERQRIIEKLLDHGTKNPGREDGILEDLLSFQAADFSEAAKEVLQKELSTSPEYTTILLVGAADVKPSLPALKAIVNEANEPLRPFHVGRKQSHTLAFAALMARARMGVKKDTQRCIQMVEAHPDERYRVVHLLDRLSYIRQPEVVEYIKKYLFIDKPEEPPSKGRSTMSYAQRAAMALAKMLRGFPGNPEYGGNQKTIEECRKWMPKQKKWNIIR